MKIINLKNLNLVLNIKLIIKSCISVGNQLLVEQLINLWKVFKNNNHLINKIPNII